jgi:hypothetical protein
MAPTLETNGARCSLWTAPRRNCLSQVGGRTRSVAIPSVVRTTNSEKSWPEALPIRQYEFNWLIRTTSSQLVVQGPRRCVRASTLQPPNPDQIKAVVSMPVNPGQPAAPKTPPTAPTSRRLLRFLVTARDRTPLPAEKHPQLGANSPGFCLFRRTGVA